jgi:hypothetical protein
MHKAPLLSLQELVVAVLRVKCASYALKVEAPPDLPVGGGDERRLLYY